MWRTDMGYRETIADGYYGFDLPEAAENGEVQELVSRFWEIYDELSESSDLSEK